MYKSLNTNKMATAKNTKGREYKFPKGIFTIVANRFRVSSMTSSKLWKRYVSNRNVEETPRHLNGRPKLTPPNVNMIEFLKKNVANNDRKRNTRQN